jgi:hypothetical protein
VRELTVPPGEQPARPIGRPLQEDHTDAYGRLTDPQRMVAHDEPEVIVRQTNPTVGAGMVWEGPPTQAQYVELVADELDSYTPAFRRWVRNRLPATAG